MRLVRDHSNECKIAIANSAVSIGRYTYGIEGLSIRRAVEGAPLTIGSFCSLATPLTVFLGGNQRGDWATTFPFGWIFQEDLGTERFAGHPASRGGVSIGNDVWTGANVTIMSGVSIGDGAIIAANSHVVSAVGPYEIFGGNPAKKIRDRFDPQIVELLQKLRWWDLPTDVIRAIAPIISSVPTIEKIEKLIAQYRHQD